ncbi:hypothetical protein [Gordonia sp. (in: high G+C Gram-positive bacteria)]|uniref:hypothetical protein n=1 Tax=Gordonia sp. (in: high G+C Gram-positive bacteria) TaxID=84139 RepID=UPI003F9940C1
MNVNARPETVRAVAAAISRAEIHDDRMTADPNRITAWAETAEPHGIDDTALACRAVDAHYTRADADTLRCGAFIGAYRKLRALDGEEAKGAAVGSLPPGNVDGGISADGEPVWDAYDQHGAIDRECPTCGAGEREACVNAVNGKTRKIPCFARLRRTQR